MFLSTHTPKFYIIPRWEGPCQSKVTVMAVWVVMGTGKPTVT